MENMFCFYYRICLNECFWFILFYICNKLLVSKDIYGNKKYIKENIVYYYSVNEKILMLEYVCLLNNYIYMEFSRKVIKW